MSSPRLTSSVFANGTSSGTNPISFLLKDIFSTFYESSTVSDLQLLKVTSLSFFLYIKNKLGRLGSFILPETTGCYANLLPGKELARGRAGPSCFFRLRFSRTGRQTMERLISFSCSPDLVASSRDESIKDHSDLRISDRAPGSPLSVAQPPSQPKQRKKSAFRYTSYRFGPGLKVSPLAPFFNLFSARDVFYRHLFYANVSVPPLVRL